MKKRRYNQTDAEVDEEIFGALEKHVGTRYPLCMKILLKCAAYDSKSSCLELNEQTVYEAEQYINENERDTIDSLTCCNKEQYHRQPQFRFLPGHRSAILAIPDKIRQMESNNMKMQNKKRKPMVEFKKLLTSTELKDLLLKRLKQSIAKIGYETDLLLLENLSDVQTIITANDLTAKCTVQCFECGAAHNLIYQGSWATSNIMRHFKKHMVSKETSLRLNSQYFTFYCRILKSIFNVWNNLQIQHWMPGIDAKKKRLKTILIRMEALQISLTKLKQVTTDHF